MSPHGHAHSDGSRATDAARARALWIGLGANGGFFVVQLLAGIAFGSLALLADSAHMASDVVALALALVALRLTTRPATPHNTYGLLRAEVIGAQVNAVLLAGASAWVAYEAVQRFRTPESVDGIGVIVVGGLGLVVNAGSAWVIERASGASLNMRGAFLHLAADALGSVGVVVSGIVIVLTDETWVDPAVSLFIAALVLLAAAQLLVEATRVLLEGAPKGLDVAQVESVLVADPAVEAVHHLHVWSIGSETPALSAHIVLRGEWTLHAAQECGDRLKATLDERFAIEHATLELECHACDSDHRAHDAAAGEAASP